MADQHKEAIVENDDKNDSNTDRNGRLGDALKTIHARKNIVRIVREDGKWVIEYD